MRRRALLAIAAVAAGSGCAGILGRESGDTGNYDHPIRVDNRHDEPHRIEVRTVVGPDDERVVFDRSVRPGTRLEREPFGDLADTGKEEFTVRARMDGGDWREVTARMNDCFGSVLVDVNAEGEFGTTYPVC